MNFKCEISLADCITWLITIVGFIIAIWQFRKQMEKDRENKVLDNKTTWYLNVIVLPHLEKLNDFYKNLNYSTITKKGILIKNKTCAHNLFTEKKAQIQREIKKEIQDFFDFFNPLISSYSNSLGIEIQKIKNDLEDIIIKYLDDESEQLEILSVRLNQNKQKFLQNLNRELSINAN